MRLRTVSANSPGWTRRRAGKGFTFHDTDGSRITSPEVVERIKSLAIPPAWKDVWICPHPTGHLQAVGTDDAGRKQYLYHPEWRVKRDKQKFDRVLNAAQELPRIRRRVTKDLARDDMPVERACALAVRLLDHGYFRIGSEVYADNHGSFGLTTLEKQHVRKKGSALVACFTGKSGVEQTVEISDKEALRALDVLRTRRGGSDRLLAFRGDDGRWRDLDATVVNAYLNELLDDLTAKDFRTWHATVIAAAELAASEEPGETKASRKRAIRAAVEEVSNYLGNTPTIAKNSYIDPRVIDLYEGGETIDAGLLTKYRDPDRRQAALEKAVLRLLS